MRKTNFYSLQGFVFIALFVLSFIKVNAQQGIACQNHLNASLSQNCSVDLTSIVNAAGAGVTIAVKNGTNALPQSALNTYDLANSQIVIGNIYTYELSNGSAKCWGTIKFEDKLAPSFSNCPAAISVSCTSTYGFSTSEVEIIASGTPASGQILSTTYTAYNVALSLPTVQECSAYKLFYSDTKSLACTPGSVGTVTRTFRAVDVNGNVGTCTQIITILAVTTPVQTPDNINLTVCPSNVNLADYTPSALFANANPTINGAAYPAFTTGDCMRSATYTDKVTTTVCGNKILRTWVVVDMCKGTLVTLTANNQGSLVQIISLTDDQAPAMPVGVKVPDIITIGTSALNCLAAQNVRFPGFVDNCNIVSRTLSVNGFSYTANTNGWVNIFGLPIGTYTGTYRATDACGNVGTIVQDIIVKDLMAPVAIADQNTNVSFTLDCTATVNATTFDDGSLDNCCLDVNRFEVKRMIELTDTVKYENLAGNRSFSDRITFVKEDLNGACSNTVQVIFRVWDCYGNSNTAMVNVKLEDKIGPIAEGADTMVMCGNTASGTDWLNSWTSRLQSLTTLQYPPVFGTNPGYFDNCDATVTWSAIEGSIDQCNNGTMTRKATVKDKCDRQACATFTFNSGQQSQYKITLPKNTKYTCPGSTVPTKAQAISDARKTLVTLSGCPVVAVDIKSEETLTATGGACYRIKRTWVVASLCHNGMQKGDYGYSDNAVMGNSASDYTYDSSNDGSNPLGKEANDDKYVEYVQVIDVYDSEKPTISNAVAPTLLKEGKCNLKLFIGGFDAADQCAPIVDKSWSLLDVNKNAIVISTSPTVIYAGGKSFPASYSLSSDDFGKKFYVRYKAEDRCGNIEVRDYLIEPSDVIKPTTVCYQGLSADLMPTTGEVWLSATMFDAGSSDGCKADARNATLLPAVANAAPATNNRMFSADNTVELRIERASGTPLAFGTSVPATNMIWVGCTGIVPIRLWSIDAAGNTDYCDTYVQIQNNMNATPKEGVCPAVTVTGAKISGNVSTSNGKVLDNALVAITSGTAANGKVTSKVVNGKYEVFVANGSDVKVSADKNDNPLNGVSTFDLVLISKHILGTQMINDVYGKQAADINNNGKITTSDIVELRKMILGLQANFNN
ncbi:MAG: dockerin type I domain-containing protein, partial [Saprospiraceae bacterium]